MDLVAPLGIRLLFVLSFVAACVAMARVWLRYGYGERDGGREHSGDAAIPRVDPVELGFVAFLSTTLVCGEAGVLLASWGRFSLLGLSLVLVPLAVVLLWAGRGPLRVRTAAPNRLTAALILLLLLAAVVYFRPHEYVLGGSDAGTYVNLSAMLARDGDFVTYDDWQSLLIEHADVMLREQPAGWHTRYLQFVGWYIDDHDPSRLIPQFFPLHPVLMAIGTALAGVVGGLYVTPLWGVLDIVIVYLITRRLFHARAALSAALLLAITPLQIWFARYPTTEPLTLLLVLTGLWAVQVLWDHEVPAGDHPAAHRVEGSRSTRSLRLWGLLGGASFGLAFLARIDLPVVWGLVIAFLMLRVLRRAWHPGLTAFAVAFATLTGQAVLSAFLINGPYTLNTYADVLSILQRQAKWLVIPGALVVGGGVAGGLWLRIRHLRLRDLNLAKWRVPRWARWLLVGMILVLSLYAYAVRPRLTPITYIRSWPAEGRVPMLNGENWVRVGWYLTPLGVLLASLGAALVVARASFYRLGLFLSVSLLTTVQYVYNAFNMPYQIYVMRRYVPIVVPALMIFAAVAIDALGRVRPRAAFRIAALALMLALSAGLLYQARFVFPQQDFRGLTDQLAVLDDELEDGAVVIIAGASQSTVPDTFGVPLRFMFDHPVATFRSENEGLEPALDAVFAYAAARNLPVQLLAADPIPAALRQALALEPITMVPVTFSVLESTYFTYPSAVQFAYYGLDLYNVARSAPARNPPGSIYVDIGSVDTNVVLDGFHGKERFPDGTTVRWTMGKASLSLPALEGPVEIQLRAMGIAPEATDPALVTVYLGNTKLGEFTPENNQWQTFSFEAEATGAGDTTELSFEAATFNPAELGMSPDDRDLGVLLDWIIIEPQS